MTIHHDFLPPGWYKIDQPNLKSAANVKKGEIKSWYFGEVVNVKMAYSLRNEPLERVQGVP